MRSRAIRSAGASPQPCLAPTPQTSALTGSRLVSPAYFSIGAVVRQQRRKDCDVATMNGLAPSEEYLGMQNDLASARNSVQFRPGSGSGCYE
jgi:hypothetical protein